MPPAALLVRNRAFALDGRPTLSAASARKIMDTRNGIGCCCGQATCLSCCRAGQVIEPQYRCCYMIGQLIKPEVVFYQCHWYAEDQETGRSAEATFVMTGGPYEISNTSGLCAVTIAASGTWRSWVDGNVVRDITGSFSLPLGHAGILNNGEWAMNFPAHPDNGANNWAPRGTAPPGDYGCDFADGDGVYRTTIQGYPFPITVTAQYQVLVSDAAQASCVFVPPFTCECLP